MPRKKHTLTIEAALSFPIASDAQIDPAGKRVAFTVSAHSTTELIRRLPKQSIWLADVKSRQATQFTSGHNADFNPRWSPDGKRIAFLSDRTDDIQLYVINVGGGEPVRLTGVNGSIDFSRSKDAVQWSPDGHEIAMLITDDKSDKELQREKKSGGAIEFEKTHRYTRLWVLNVESRKLRLVTRHRMQIWEFQWSPDGEKFALIASDYPYEWSWYHSRLVRLPAKGGNPRTIYSPPIRQIALPRWSPDGKQLAFISSIWSDRGSIDGDVFVVSARGGEPRNVTEGYHGSIGWVEWIKNGGALRTAGYEQSEAALCEVNVRQGTVKTLWRKPIAIAENYWPRFTRSKNATLLAAVRSSNFEARNVWLAKLSGRRATWTKLSDAAPQVRDFELGEQEIIHWQSRDGWTIHGVLLKPVGYRRGRRYPLIVNPHGGPTSLFTNGFIATNFWGQLLAARGYAVFFPNYRGSTGFGLRYAEANVGDLGGMDFEDIESGVEALIERGLADPDRLGIGGWSYGGFMTAWAVTQTDRYKAAVAGAAITNWLSFHGNSHLHAWDAIHYDANPYERGGLFDKFNPMHYVHQVNTPTLVAHGQQDRDVPAEQGYQFYRALRDHGIAAELVLYPREAHAFVEQAHWVDLHTRIGNWYDRFLK